MNVGLTEVQKKLYCALLRENAGMLLRQITRSSLGPLQRLLLQLVKVCVHPFLLYGADNGIAQYWKETEPYKDKTLREIKREAIVTVSGKMVLLDKLLTRLRAENRKVVIASHMVRVLDIVQGYLTMKGCVYERIDGSTGKDEREVAESHFKNEDGFVVLLSTERDNVVFAEVVIIFDGEWNARDDAVNQCHRIGVEQVTRVYRFVCLR